MVDHLPFQVCTADSPVQEKDFIRSYIAEAKQFNPTISPALTEFIVSTYVEMRREQGETGEAVTYITARSLLAILRLSTALARLRGRNEVNKDDVEEAIRLTHASKASILDKRSETAGGRRNITNEIFKIIQALAEEGQNPEG